MKFSSFFFVHHIRSLISVQTVSILWFLVLSIIHFFYCSKSTVYFYFLFDHRTKVTSHRYDNFRKKSPDQLNCSRFWRKKNLLFSFKSRNRIKFFLLSKYNVMTFVSNQMISSFLLIKIRLSLKQQYKNEKHFVLELIPIFGTKHHAQHCCNAIQAEE